MIQALQFILSLSILIVLHELGHFIPARLFKTKIEKFYLFFDPWFSLFKIKRGETEYGLGWLPLGGYVKIAGMIDESMDKEQMKQPPQPWEFRSKPAWQRLIIMLGGVTVNVILGILIFAMVLFVWGEKYLPSENAKYGIVCDSTALQMGFKDGDKIVAVNHKQVENFNALPLEIILNKAQSVQVLRNNQQMDVEIKEEFFTQLLKGKHTLFDPAFPCEVDSILPGTAADKSGLKKGDQILSINSIRTPFFSNVVNALQTCKEKEIEVNVLRSNDTVVLKAQVSADGKLGFATKNIDKYLEFHTRRYGFIESFPAGVRRGLVTMSDYIKQMKFLFTTKDAHKSLGGFITIGKAYSPEWDWYKFWSFTAFLSIVLAIMNVLPIPALDGGHVMFLLYEVVTRRKPNEKIMEYAQYAGMILLLSLLLYANGNDVMRLFGK
ncbi:MAG: RIP metalloprotease RseP [Bacteroidia bacterium]|nr:RIP metalloprotease RseP [Bacteroidia bacterium]